MCRWSAAAIGGDQWARRQQLWGRCHENKVGSQRRIGQNVGMAPLCYRRHRFPPEIIQHAIWLYLRFTLSYRDPSVVSTSLTKRCGAGC